MSDKKRKLVEDDNERTKQRQSKLSFSSSFNRRGTVTVAKYKPGSHLPETPGFKNVLIHTSDAILGGDLSPYILRNEKGHLLENIWQFAKIYRRVEKQVCKLSRFHPNTVIWDHPMEQHIVGEDTVTREYWVWRKKGVSNPYAVRYPNGFNNRRAAVASLWVVDGQLRWLDYIAARKHIYCAEYARLAPKTDHFRQLRNMLLDGQNIQILEVDGPDPSLDYGPYQTISKENPGMAMNEETIKFLLNDTNKPFGHGFTIAALLLNGSEWLAPEA